MSSVAAFDVDGTLTVRDCVLPFMRRVAGSATFATRGASSLWRTPRSLLRRDRDALKAHFAGEIFTGRSVQSVLSEGERFASFVLSNWMRRDVLARLRWHQRSGHEVVLVSASLGPYLRPFGESLGVRDVLCTELEEADGVFTGHLMGRNCRGEEKVTRLTGWLADRGLDTDGVEWAYGDSSGDEHLLRFARNGTYVRRMEVPEVPS